MAYASPTSRHRFRLNAVKSLAIALMACVAFTSASQAAPLPAPLAPVTDALVAPAVPADWQGPLSLPPYFRNHCAYHLYRDRYFCRNHCGIGYQFYFCHPDSFGCCHVGRGYCNWNGSLTCAP
jgi:hypothetical protein